MPLHAIVAVLLAATPSVPRGLPFADGGWELRGDAAVVTHEGREALAVGTGWAFRRDVRLVEGTIELDLQVTRQRSFVYITFRMEGDDEHEEIYLRPHKSGLPDAVQYAPVRQGRSAWQLHHGPGATAAPEFEPGKWTRVRLAFRDRVAALYLGEEPKPVFVARLNREPRPGFFALRAFAPSPGTGPVALFAAVRVHSEPLMGEVSGPPEAPAEPAGVVRAWAVSESLTPVAEPPPSPPPAAGFRSVEAEAGGLVSLLRHVRTPRDAERWATAARVSVRTATPGPRRFDLGFSDTATVYLNGRPLFHADARYSFDNPRQEGLIHFGQASLFLPLQAGANELVIVVSDVFGGWGLMGRFPDDRDLVIEAR